MSKRSSKAGAVTEAQVQACRQGHVKHLHSEELHLERRRKKRTQPRVWRPCPALVSDVGGSMQDTCMPR
eukprot:364589-Chlamydomonas_euryale.AAC.14